MKIYRILLIFLCITLFTSCTTYHFFTHKEAVKLAKKRNKKIGGVTIDDDDKVLKVQTIFNQQKVNEVYQFDDKGKQVNYRYIASCDSCYKIILAKQLNDKIFKWKKINDSTYITKYNLQRFLNIHKSNLSFDYAKHSLSKPEYKSLVANRKK